MNRVIIIFLLAGLAILTCCQHKDSAEKIKKIDSLITICDSLSNTLASVNNDSAEIVFQKAKASTELFEKKLRNLPESDTVRECLNSSGNIFKGLRKYFKELPSYKKDIDFSHTQLTNLKEDVKNNLLNEEEFSKYYKDESVALSLLSEKINGRISTTKNELSLYKRICFTVNYLVDSLNKMKPESR
jgi:hypothetical protein